MSLPFWAPGYALLCFVVFVEATLLLEIWRQTVSIGKTLAGADSVSSSTSLPRGTRVPNFSIPLLNRQGNFQMSDIRGHRSVLVFLVPRDATSAACEVLLAGIHKLWHRMEGHVYLVCLGSYDVCGQIVRDHLKPFPKQNISIDEAGVLARHFRIEAHSQAVELDEEARVGKYGRLESATDATLDGSVETTVQDPHVWPDNRSMSGAGFARMDTTISCVLTRFRLNSPLSLIPFYFGFRRVQQDARKIAGLLQAVFLVENLRTCYTLSLWRDDAAIVQFGNLRTHVGAANSAFRATYRPDQKRAEIWSAQFRLWAVSCHNLNWEGVDLQPLLADQWHKRDLIAKMQSSPTESNGG